MNKIFMGDAGIYFLSMLSGLIIIDMSNNNLIYSEEIFLLMMLPGIDMLRLFFLRIINKKNPFNPDKLHIHHILFNKLKSKAKTVLTIIMIYGFPILLKISLDFKTLYLIIIQLLFYLIIFYLIRDVTFYDKKK